MSTEIFVQDVTLRDGMHAVRHRITPADVKRIVRALDEAGVDAIEVAHGDGLAGGSVTYGPGSHTDWEWIEAAAEQCQRAVLTTLLLPGIGTIAELKHAYSLGVRSVRLLSNNPAKAQGLRVNGDPEISEIHRDVAPEAVLDEIESSKANSET